MATPIDHDAYIAQAAEHLRPLLVDLREQISAALPDASEIIAYNMPGFQIETKIIAGYAAFSKQCGLYVAPAAIAAHLDRIKAAGHKPTKTGVTFSDKNPLDARLVADLVQTSRKANGF